MRPGRIALIALLVVGIGASYVFGQVEGGFFAWFLFAFVLVLAVYELLTGIIGLRRVEVTRRLSASRLSAGQTLQIHVEVLRRGLWPIFWIRIRDELPSRFTFQTKGNERVLLPLWTQKLQYDYRIAELPRGVYTIGETTMESGDLLGILVLRRRYRRSDSVTVYPQVVPVRGWNGVQPEEFGLRDATRQRSDESTNVLGVRDYVPGDRLSRVHWPATARRGQLLAKEFEMHVSSELLFVPDLSESSYRGLDGSVFELTMTIVASLMKHAYERHRKFGMTMVGNVPKRFPAGADEALFLRCMESLAMASPDGYTPFSETLARVAQEAPMGTLLVVVSPKLDRPSVVAAEGIRRRTPLEWFAPTAQNELTEEQRRSLDWLSSMRVATHPVRTADQLSQLMRGGSARAVNVQ